MLHRQPTTTTTRLVQVWGRGSRRLAAPAGATIQGRQLKQAQDALQDNMFRSPPREGATIAVGNAFDYLEWFRSTPP